MKGWLSCTDDDFFMRVKEHLIHGNLLCRGLEGSGRLGGLELGGIVRTDEVHSSKESLDALI